MTICDVFLGGIERRQARWIELVGRFDAAKTDHRRRTLPLDATFLTESEQNKGQHTNAENEHKEESDGDDNAGRGNGDQLATLHRS